MKLGKKLEEIWEGPYGILLAFAPMFIVGGVLALVAIYLTCFG